MPNFAISELPAATDLADADSLPIVQGGVTKKLPGTAVAKTSELAASSGASLIGFAQSGIGASSRTVQAKLRDIVSATDFGVVGNGSTDDTTAIQAAIDAVATNGGTVFLPAAEYLVSKQSSTVAEDTFTGIGCAIKLKDWVSLLGDGIGTSSTSVKGTRFKLANTQNCHVLGNFADTSSGLHGCRLSNFGINGNRDNNSTAGSGIFIGSVYSNTVFENIKIGESKENGIRIAASSTPVWLRNVLVGAVGKAGVYIDGANSTAVHIENLQVDSAGVDGGGEAGLYINQLSTQDSQIIITNYRYEYNTTSEPTASGLGIEIKNGVGGTVEINGAYGFANAAAADFIKLTGTTVTRLNMKAVMTSSNYTNIFNDSVNTKTVAYSTRGIQNWSDNADVRDVLRIRANTTNGICTLSTSAGSGRLTVNKLSDGGTGGNIDIYQGTDSKKVNIDGNGTPWFASGSIKFAGASESAPSVTATTGSATPEGAISANIGSLRYRTDGGEGKAVYQKVSGTGNTGWRPLGVATETAVNIAAVTASINTTDKHQGRLCYDTTNNRLMVSNGSAAIDNWYVADGSASVTPA
jgi:hypothetical protein